MTEWTDEFLDQMRLVGDPLADDTVAQLYAGHDVRPVNQLLGRMLHYGDVPPDELPQCVRDYLAQTAGGLDGVDEERLLAGQDLFAQYGPEVSMVLSTYSLPSSYCAAKGVEVLWRTAKLYTNPLRRVMETAQMVIDVMQPGGIQKGGPGQASAMRVRLMHAGVRHLIGNDAANPWDLATLGLPINQEDMAGTLGIFSYRVLDGLERLHIPLSDEQRDSFIYAWDVVGTIMGVRPELRPQSFQDARALSQRIHDRQVRASDAGREMMAAIIGMMEQQIPGHLFDGIAPTMVRHFIQDDPLCDQMGVPPGDWTQMLLRGMEEALHLLGLEERAHPPLRIVARSVGLAILRAALVAERGGVRPRFAIPHTLAEGWGAYAAK